MAWGVRWYLVGSIILGLLGVLAGCSGGGFFAEREPWRHEAEVQCLNTGAVKESAGIVRIRQIRGPGMCGADFPLKVSILGESGPLGYSDELRPPGDIPRGAAPSRWPIRPAEPPYQSRVLPDYQSGPPQPPRRDTAPDEPVSLNPPGVVDQPTMPAEPYDFRRPYGVTPAAPPPKYRSPSPTGSPRDDFSPEPYERRPLVDAPGRPRDAPRASAREPPPGALGPASDHAGRGEPAGDARMPDRVRARTLDRRRRAAGGDALVPLAGCRDQTNFRLFLSRHERQFAGEPFRARLRQRARHRGVYAR